MSRLATQIVGAKGIDSRKNRFVMDPLHSQIAENFSVRSNTREVRQAYERVLYEQYYANCVRLRSREQQYIVLKDPNNEAYQGFGGATGKGTMFFRFRLHGEEGFSFRSLIPLVSREVYTSSLGTGVAGHLKITLQAVDVPAHDEYFIKVDLTNASSGGFTQVSTHKVKYSVWHRLAIRYSPISGDVDIYLDGAWETFGSKTGQAGTGAYIHDSIENFHGDILIGANEALTTFADMDIDEFRLYNDAMADAVIEDNDDQELAGTDATNANLECYVNFQEDSEKQYVVDKRNANVLGLLGGYRAFIDEDKQLVLDGHSTFAELSVSTVLGFTYTVFNSNRTNEIALTFLKMKQGWIVGDLELVPDVGNSKWAVKFHFREGGVPVAQTLTTAGFIDEADVGVTQYHIGVRIDTFSVPSTVKIYVDGVEAATHNLLTNLWAPTAAGTGRNIGTKYSLNVENVAMKLAWVRAMRWTKPVDYFTDFYNQEVPQVDVDTVRHGTMIGLYNSGGGTVALTPSEATWQTSISLPTLAASVGSRDPGDEHSDNVTITGADTASVPAPTRGTWDAISVKENTDRIWNQEAYAMTLLVVRFNAVAFTEVVSGAVLGIDYVENNSLATDGFDSQNRSSLRLLLRRRFPTGTAVDKDRPPIRIFSETKLTDSLGPVRFMRQFRDEAENIDVIIVIVGTAFMAVDRATLVVTNYPVPLETNGFKRFTSALLENQMYITDGLSKIHLYVFKGVLKAKIWGMKPPAKLPTATAFTGVANPWNEDIQYTYAYYNSEIDQYSNIAPLSGAGAGAEVSGARRASKLDDLDAAVDPVSGATDIVILGTRIVAGNVDTTDYRIIDYIGSRSTGTMDWNQAVPTGAATRWPRSLLGGEDLSPPDGSIVVSHRKRVWVLKGRTLHYSRLDSDLHAVTKSQTYMYPFDHTVVVDADQNLTAAMSLDGMLFIFTCSELYVLAGFDRSDFDLRPLYSGRGCVSHHTLRRWGETFMWLGQEDIYQLVNGRPEPVDREGKISQYLKDNLNLSRLDDAFAIINRDQEIYELHVIRKNGDNIVIYWDLKTQQFTIGTDILAVNGAEVEEDCRSTVFLGHEKGFLVKESDTQHNQNYEPPSGALSGTVVLLSGVDTLITSESTLYTTDVGLRGNTVYVVSQQAGTEGAVLRAKIVSNTTSNIIFSDSTFVFGDVFVPALGDLFYVAPIFWHWKSGILSSGRQSIIIQKEALRTDGELFSDVVAQELIELEFLHEPTNVNAVGYFKILRDNNIVSTPFSLLDLNSFTSLHQFVDTSKHRFLEIEAWIIDQTGGFNMAGFVMDRNLTRGTHVA